MIRRIRRILWAIEQFEDSPRGDALGVVLLFGGLFALLWWTA